MKAVKHFYCGRAGTRASILIFLLASAIFPSQKQTALASAALIFPAYKATVTSEANAGFALNKHLNLVVVLSSLSDGAPPILDFKFDARMPQHKHGMVTKPKIVKISSSEYRVEGVRLHMPGMWLFEIILTHQNGETRISSPFDLKPT